MEQSLRNGGSLPNSSQPNFGSVENTAQFASLGFLNEDQQKRVMSAYVRSKQQLIAHAIRLNDAQSVAENVEQLLHISVPYDVKFLNLKFKELLLKNSDSVDDLRRLRDGLFILQKYGTNLMQPPLERPKQWRVISLSIVNSVRGCKDVLMEIGYTIETDQSLEFPQSLQPDLTIISLILSDIALALKELDAYLDGSHSAARYIDDCIRPGSRILQTNVRGATTSVNQSEEGGSDMSSNISFNGNDVITSGIDHERIPVENSGSISTSSLGELVPTLARNSLIGRDASVSIISSPAAEPVAPARKFSEDEDDVCDSCGQRQWNNFCRQCEDNQFTCDRCNALLHGHKKRSSHRVEHIEPCDICGLNNVSWKCSSCEINKLLCNSCNVNVHQNPRRLQHVPLLYRRVLLTMTSVTSLTYKDVSSLLVPYASSSTNSFVARQPNAYYTIPTKLPNDDSPQSTGAGRGRYSYQIEQPHFLHSQQNASTPSYLGLSSDSRHTDMQTSFSYAGVIRSTRGDRQPSAEGSAHASEKENKVSQNVWPPSGEDFQKKYLEGLTDNDSNSENKEASKSLPEPERDRGATDLLAVKDEQSVLLELQMTTAERDGREIVSTIRQAERENFHIDEVLLARLHNSSVPFSWLRNNWPQLQDATRTGVAKELSNLGQDVALVRPCDIRASLIASSGVIESSVECCRDMAINKIEAVSKLLWCSRESASVALCANAGSSSDACRSLHESTIAEFCSKWKTPDTDSTKHYETIEELLRQIEDRQRKVRLLLTELRLHCWADGECVLSVWEHFIGNETVTLADIVEAHSTCSSQDDMKAFLQWECAICTGLFPANKFLKLVMCECRICKDCMQGHFSVRISEFHVMQWTCPACQNPDMSSNDAAVHLQFLDSTLRGIISVEQHELFEKKLRDWHLMSDPNFRWCQGGGAGCGSGSIYHIQRNQLKIVCIDCGHAMCFKCKKPWEAQHENVTCDAFALWKLNNDPQHQAQALANYLEENGIDCPQCKYKFALAKGGCMHFKCNRCAHEFCCGCSEPFKHGNSCKKFANCSGMGLHCHHPRDCLFYLRDMSIESLCRLLRNNNVAFERNQPPAEHASQTCLVMEQKEDGAALRDEACGREVREGCGGLCEVHYKEYLVGLINKRGIDPVSVWSLGDMENELKRNNKASPAIRQQSEQERKSTLAQVIQNEIPLSRSVSRNTNSLEQSIP